MSSQTVVLIDRPTANVMRAAMAKAADEWNGTIKVEAGPDTNRNQRLIARAYAQMFGITLTDDNDSIPGGALTRSELARLPALRDEIRALHPEARILNKAVNGTGKLLVNGSVASLRGAVEVLLPFIAAPLALRKIAVYVPLMYVFFGLAFGFGTPFHYAGVMLRWIIEHPSDTWLGVRILTGLMFAYMVVGCIRVLTLKEEVDARPVGGVGSDNGNGYGQYAIQDFREASPYGDASLAQKQVIARALQGHNVSNAPRFED